MSSQAYEPRLVSGMIGEQQVTPRERRELRLLVDHQILDPLTKKKMRKELIDACLSYRETVALAKHEEPRQEVLAQLRAIENGAQLLFDGIAEAGLEALTRMADVEGPGADLWWPKEQSRLILWILRDAHHARASLQKEGAAGGRRRDRPQRELMTAAARIWRENGGHVEASPLEDPAGQTPWEAFACALYRIAEPTKRDAKTAGLKVARELARNLTEKPNLRGS